MPSNQKIQKKLAKLRRAQTLLQKGHDYIEAVGFDIDQYGEGAQPVCCHIGTLRHVADLPEEPLYDETLDEDVAADGDGPELIIAFEFLDKVAKRFLTEEGKGDVKDEYSSKGRVGRFVEYLGFETKKEIRNELGISLWGMNGNPLALQRQQDEALKIWRKALTAIYREIEKQEAKLVA